MLQHGAKLLVAHRRLFEDDKSRYFVGKVEGFENALVQLTGHTWVQDQFNGKMVKKEEVCTKIMSPVNPGLIFYVLPNSLALDELVFEFTEDNRLLVHDPKKIFRMDLTEMCHAK